MSTHELRAPRPDEAEAIAQALNSDEGRLYRGTTLEEVAGWFDAPDLDLDHDARLAVLPDRRIAGYADVYDDGGAHRSFWMTFRLAAGSGEHGSALVTAMEERCAATALPGAVLRVGLAEADDAARAVVEAHGYRVVRHTYRMSIDLDDAPPPAVWPDDIRVRSCEPGRDDERVYEAHMEAFADMWEFVPGPYESWRHWMLQPPHDPELWFLAVEGDEIAGFCLAKPADAGDATVAWIPALGVRRPWRGRGVGLALLLHAFAEFQRRGKRSAVLGVDAASPTGAVRLYERAGMHVARRYLTYEKSLGRT